MIKSNDYFDGFEPIPDFDPFCPPVCGNCMHWDSEVHAWGMRGLCSLSGESRCWNDCCDVRKTEVMKRE